MTDRLRSLIVQMDVDVLYYARARAMPVMRSKAVLTFNGTKTKGIC